MMGSGYMGWFMILFWGLLLVTLILLIRWVVKLPQSKESGQGKDPLAILNERLAKGEIEVEEYREKKQLLTGKP
ncbi:MAG: SHOCT domain-containing protein [Proteobacteria bacterium]|nr:SHOCT domain-containing protein [Pseudomonadota bacterium]MBU1584214.1 SHOCT domain-containing protein [Pseudomonadota bacterium]MBU2431974.1 SHOCT domain-containing protein [Pseudomonadota bacterium]MBU2455047.1 SHOCT domain-containing protein [Pseudomonadota bacterium]